MPSETQIALYYASCGLSPRVISELEEMRQGAPCRQVALGALTHTRIDFFSRRNNARRQFESNSCEHLFGLILELTDANFAYWNQVALKGIRRGSKVNAAVADFLLYDNDRIRVIECKPLGRVRRLAEKRPDEWQLTRTGWTRPALAQWCQARGMHYEVWSPPEPFGVYLANAMALYNVASQAKPSDTTAQRKLTHLVSRGPCTIAEVMSSVGCAFQDIAQLLIAESVFGPIKSIPIDQTARFTLFSDKGRAELVDAENLRALLGDGGTPSITAPVLTASSTDYSYGERRLARVRRMLAGTEPVSRRYRPLVKAVAKADAEGGVALEKCLTAFHKSGRRLSQLTNAQSEALKEVARLYLKTPLIRTKKQLYFELQSICERRGCVAPSPTTLNREISKVHPQWRALSTGGRRAFHAIGDPVDPVNRTVDPRLPFLKVHVDSSKFDNRLLNEVLGPSCPVLYVAMDAATSIPLARALVFGRACRDVLAVLIRDMVVRHARVPAYWVVDQGTEYRKWFTSFCTHTGASRYYFPVGAPKHNAWAENAINRINSQIAHQLLGSTAPDKAGRSVDNKVKSYRTAKHVFETALQMVDSYLFEDVPNTPSSMALGSPQEQYDDLVASVGIGGKAVKYDDDFRILTSIPVDRDIKVTAGKGLRHEGRTYACSTLFEALRGNEKIVEIRRDCVDPTVLYVKLRVGWVTASSSDCLRLRSESAEGLLFELLAGPSRRVLHRKRQNEIGRARYDKLKLANASAAAVKHFPASEKLKEVEPRLQRGDWSTLLGDEIEPYRPEEDE